MTDQLPPARIIQFPVDRDAYLTRETARIMMIRQGAASSRFWQMTCRRLYARLQVQGLPHADIEREVQRFASAVAHRIDLVRRFECHQHNPRGAA